ncbi:MAG: hypothetical protein DRJ42_30175 [Deltaproteobacteria bacterium]|nr:MAG: hypothetical protein DRJ42_30175 [Deltaproteobacteria bacterium]
MRNALISSSALLLVLAFGCSESTTAEPDSGISFMPPDVGPDTGTASPDGAAPDAGEVSGDIGIVCMSDGDCDVFCASEDQGFRDGYCTSYCDEDNPCPDGSTCLRAGPSQSICFAGCDPAAEERSCRAGYGCAVSPRIPDPVCIPGCTDDTDCDADRTCNPSSGGNCFNPEATWGDACDDHAACPDTAFCFAEAFRGGWPSGMCVAFGCDPMATDGGGCPTETVCIPLGRPDFGACVPSCETDENCRDAYTCAAPEEYPERLGCQPGCTDDSQCTDGRTCGPDGNCV